MPSPLSDVVFSEPSGRPTAVVMFAGAVLFTGLHVYGGMGGDGSSNSWQLVMVVGFTLSGIAESLPNDRRRIAGIFRVAAIFVLVGLLATTIFAPEFILGER